MSWIVTHSEVNNLYDMNCLSKTKSLQSSKNYIMQQSWQAKRSEENKRKTSILPIVVTEQLMLWTQYHLSAFLFVNLCKVKYSILTYIKACCFSFVLKVCFSKSRKHFFCFSLTGLFSFPHSTLL